MSTTGGGADARLRAVLEPVVTAAGADLDDLHVGRAGRRSLVRVLVDRDGGVTLDEVAELSRLVSSALDALGDAEPEVLGGSYLLEVSSPGIDRPLTQPRHWRRSAGHLVTAVLVDGATLTGRVLDADEQAATLDLDGARRQIRYDQVRRASVQVEFARPEERP